MTSFITTLLARAPDAAPMRGAAIRAPPRPASPGMRSSEAEGSSDFHSAVSESDSGGSYLDEDWGVEEGEEEEGSLWSRDSRYSHSGAESEHYGQQRRGRLTAHLLPPPRGRGPGVVPGSAAILAASFRLPGCGGATGAVACRAVDAVSVVPLNRWDVDAVRLA